MTVKTKLLNGDAGGDFRDTINDALLKGAGVYTPKEGTGNDASAIQAAMDAAVAGGGGVVWLGNKTWAITATLELDVNYVALRGHNAQLNFTGTRDVGIHMYSSSPANPGSGVETLECNGLHLTFASTINKGLYFYQADNPNQQNGSKNWSNCAIAGAKNTIEIADNAYIFTFRKCAIGAAGNVCVYRLSSKNNSERVTFDDCTFYNSPRFLDLTAVSADYYFINCSFDYPTLGFSKLNSGDHTYIGCHFEGKPTDRPFEMDNSAIAHYIGCFFGMTVATPWMWTTWGQGAELHITDCFQGLSSTSERLFSDPHNVVLTNFSTGSTGQQKKLATTGTATPIAFYSNSFFVTLTGALVLAAPTHGTRGKQLSFFITQAATGTGPFALTFTGKWKWEGGVAPTIGQNGGDTLMIFAQYDAVGDVWYARTDKRVRTHDVNFAAAGSVYLGSEAVTVVEAVGAKLGAGNITYKKNTAADAATFTTVVLPTTLDAGARIQVASDGAAYQQLRMTS